MKGHFYFTHPIEASLDPRMEAMEEKLHGKGFGVYWYIREKMSYFGAGGILRGCPPHT